jgi:disulfide bond formation protein DsbB
VINKLFNIGNSIWYWSALIALGVASEGAALFYQYVLDYPPCVLCIQTRLWFVVLIIIAITGLIFRKSRKLSILSQSLIMLTAVGLLERSYQLLSIERGWAFGSCDFDLGLPQWLAVEEWFPSIFKVWESCGYTPEILFGITMAEALLILSSILLVLSLSIIAATFMTKTTAE